MGTELTSLSTYNESINTLIGLINNQLQLMGIISSLFLGLAAIILAILAFLVWKNNETRKKVEEDVRAIQDAHEQIVQVLGESVVIKNSLSKNAEDAERIINSLKEKEGRHEDKKLNELSEIISELKKDILDKTNSNILRGLSDNSDIRFNFFVSPKHSQYLDYISKYKNIPRSVYLRQLLDNDMKKSLKK